MRRLYGILLLCASSGLVLAQTGVPTINLSVSPGSSTYGQTVTLTAAVSGIPGGATITFLDNGATMGTALVSNSNQPSAVFPTSSLTAGTHSLQATYNQPGGATIRSNTVSSQVSQVATSITLTSQPNPSNSGQQVTFTASVAAGATGSVTFSEGSTQLGSGLIGSAGNASIAISNLTPGSHVVIATYGGDANFTGSTSKSITQVVNSTQVQTTTTLTGSPNPAVFGTTVTLTATVTGSGATGTVTFSDNGVSIGTGTLSNGSASFSTGTLAVGTHSLTAAYGGNTNFLGSTSAIFTETINKITTSTSLAANPTQAALGQTVVLTATVAGAGATGSVTFLDGQTTIGSSALNSSGVATFSTSTLTAGQHAVTAAYGGDTTHASSTSTAVTVTITAKTSSTTTISANPNPAQLGQAVTVTATVTPAGATGTVTFFDGQTNVGTATLSIGNASISVTPQVGTHVLTATYNGDANNNSSTSPAVTLVVNSATGSVVLTASPNPATAGQNVLLQAAVTPATATGTVNFRDGNASIGTANVSSGFASFNTSSLTAGSHTLTAVYSGDANNTSATSTAVVLVVNKAASNTTLSITPVSVNAGQTVNMTATVAPLGATGSVTFSDGVFTLGTVNLSTGTAFFSTNSLSAGTHSVTAAYSGDSVYSPSTSTIVSVTVNQGTTTVTLTATPNPAVTGQPVTLTAVVSPATATGTVTFRDGGSAIGTANLSNGSATFTTSTLTVGTHPLTAFYGGDNANPAATSPPVNQVINAGSGSVTLTGSPNPAAAGQAVTLTVTVTPSTATGSITIFDALTSSFLICLGSTDCVLRNGVATLTTSTLAVGIHQLQAFYGGDAANPASQSNIFREIINAGGTPTTTTLTASPTTAASGQTVTLTATVTPAGATGLVTFSDGSTSLGTAPLSGGVATLGVSTLAGGSHSITATYAGDANNASSTSTAITINVSASQLQTSTTALSASTTSPASGAPVTLTATVNPLTATGSVTFLDGTTSIGSAPLSGGIASLTVSTLAPGSHSLTASYGGDSKVAQSTSTAISVTVGPALTATRTLLATLPNPAVAGKTVTLTATVTPGAATGTVTFLDGTTTLGTAALSAGVATFTIASLTVGSHSLTASYGGDSNNAPSVSSTVTQSITAATTLQITSGTPPPAFVNTPYSFAFSATGGVPPYTWSLVGGPVNGLNLSANGLLSGTPAASGNLTLNVRVADSANQAPVGVFGLAVQPVSSVNLTIPTPTTPADQPVPLLSLSSPYPFAVTGTITLTFAPNAAGLPAGFNDAQFVSGGTTFQVVIPANSTTPQPAIPALQLGSVAGDITGTLGPLTVQGSTQAVPFPGAAPAFKVTVPRLAPIIAPGSVKITAITASSFQITLNASSTPRDLTSAAVTFTSASGTTLNGCTSNCTVQLGPDSATWFTGSAGVSNGGAFSLTLTFPYSGDTSALNTASVVLSNSVGPSAAVSGGK